MDALWTVRAYAGRVESKRAEHAFLVRTWREAGTAGERAEWRGSVEHLLTKERRYFRDFADLCAFILTHQLADKPKP